jgi:hypothetical protein
LIWMPIIKWITAPFWSVQLTAANWMKFPIFIHLQ